MSDDAQSKFVYVTYIRTTPEKLWRALIEPEFTKQYWDGTTQECDWKAGAPWRLMIPDGRVADAGEIIEIDPHRRLVLTWQNEFRPELNVEAYSRLTYELEQQGEMVKLDAHTSDELAGIETDRGGVERMAGDPRQPEKLAGNWQVA